MREIGYAAFVRGVQGASRRAPDRKDVDGWLLKKYADTPDNIPDPEVAIPKRKKRQPPPPRVSIPTPPPVPEPEPEPESEPRSDPVRAYSESNPDIERSLTMRWRRRWIWWRGTIVSGPPWITKVTMRGDKFVRVFGDHDRILKDFVWVNGIPLRFVAAGRKYCQARIDQSTAGLIREGA